MFQKGLTPSEIAAQRKLTVGTIQQHLLPYIASGEVSVEQLVSPEKFRLIADALKDFKKEDGITPIKNKLPEDISYPEIRYVLASHLIGDH
jgi:uncharacterized protein YpbB